MARGRTASRKGTTRVVEGDMSRLPLWAQNKIAYLKRDLEAARARFAELGQELPRRDRPSAALPEAGTITFGKFSDREIIIPTDDHVTIYLGGDDDIRFDYDRDENRVQVHASTTLEIELSSSNVAFLATKSNRVREKLLEARAEATVARIRSRPGDFSGKYRDSLKQP